MNINKYFNSLVEVLGDSTTLAMRKTAFADIEVVVAFRSNGNRHALAICIRNDEMMNWDHSLEHLKNQVLDEFERSK